MDHSPERRSWLARIFLVSGERRLRAGFRLLGQLVLLGVSYALLAAVLLVLSLLLPSLEGNNYLLLAQGSTVLAVTVSVYLARRILDRCSFISLGLVWNGTAVSDLIVGFLIAGIMMTLIYILEWLAGWLSFQGFTWQYQPPYQVLAGTTAMLLVFLVAGWAEELLNRGYWLQNLEEGLNLFWAVLLSSLFFSISHIGNPHIGAPALLGLLAAGIFLAYGYTSTRQLWLPIGLHTGWNFFESTLLGFPVSGLGGLPQVVRQSVAGPNLFTGGMFGPEAGLVLAPALVLGALLVHLYTRRRMGVAQG